MTRWLGASLAVAGAARAAEIDLSRLPPAATRPVDFATDIQPLFERSCLSCHGPERPKSGFRLDDRDLALQGGDLGAAILPGASDRSPLIHFVARLVEDMEMPPPGRFAPLTDEEIGLLRAWIDQGAPWSDAPSTPQVTASVTPAVQFFSVRGNEARFREHQWTREGWGGGATDFRLKYDLDPRTRVDIEGQAMVGPDAYRFSGRIERDDLGWSRLEYREFSRFQDDTGGAYAPFGTAAQRWGEDFVLRHRHATVEFGLDMPDWPRLRLAYDLHLREGTEATLHWGEVTQGGVSRRIAPAIKRVDEATHQLSFDLQYDWDGLLLSNETRFEWYDQDNQRTQREETLPPLDRTTVIDRHHDWRGANALRLERSLRDWLHLSGGYLYSHLDGGGAFRVRSSSSTDPSVPPSLDRSTDDLVLRRQSHVVNGNLLLGPWEDLHAYGGLQAEWSRQEGFATGQVFGFPTSFDSNIDRAATDENFGIRYAGLPFTVVFVETRFQQETLSQFEEGLDSPFESFLRDTDAEGDTQSYEAGFTVSPWRQASLGVRLRHRHRENTYDHVRDIDPLSNGNGYPAFIRARDTETDEIEARLVLRPARWLKATLRYSLSATDFETTTESWETPFVVPPVINPGGRILAGNYEAHTAGLGLVITPWHRLHWSTTLTYATSRTASGVDGSGQVVPYQGDTWNLLDTLTFVLDEKTDLLLTHLFSDADYAQNNAGIGLPLGVEFTRHAATAGIVRRMKHDRVLRLEYGFFTYDEPTLGGAADYTAHGLFASWRVPWK